MWIWDESRCKDDGEGELDIWFEYIGEIVIGS